MLGTLDTVPLFINEFQCQKCKGIFSFMGGLRCSCERSHKFKTKRIIVNGIKFDSLGEGRRYSKLKFLEVRGIISKLELQPKFDMQYNGCKICTYRADFKFDYAGNTIIEDYKGRATAVFKLKQKLMKAFYPNVVLDIISSTHANNDYRKPRIPARSSRLRTARENLIR